MIIVLLPSLIGDKTWKNENGLYAKLFKRAEVGFDALRKCEGEPTRSR
jgi:hypothetical protein